MEQKTKLESALDELLAGKTPEEIAGPNGLLKQLTKALVERAMRSEEHTSELQSHVKLVCRLLLEKKNRCRALDPRFFRDAVVACSAPRAQCERRLLAAEALDVGDHTQLPSELRQPGPLES